MTREEKQKAIDAIKISAPVMAVTQEEFNDYIQTLNKIMDWLEQEPCKDAISRKAVIKHICEEKFCYEENCKGVLFNRCPDITWVNDLPPIKPQEPKTGHWILKRTFPTKLYDECLNEYKCSECYREIRCTESQLVNYPYCHCGAKMSEIPTGSESEDK